VWNKSHCFFTLFHLLFRPLLEILSKNVQYWKLSLAETCKCILHYIFFIIYFLPFSNLLPSFFLVLLLNNWICPFYFLLYLPFIPYFIAFFSFPLVSFLSQEETFLFFFAIAKLPFLIILPLFLLYTGLLPAFTSSFLQLGLFGYPWFPSAFHPHQTSQYFHYFQVYQLFLKSLVIVV
jgi:hypothetical protein